MNKQSYFGERDELVTIKEVNKLELKTLKDFKIQEYPELGDVESYKDELRQEAIKQYNYYQELSYETNSDYIKSWYDGKLDFIYNFFNLKDKDIK